MPDSDFLFSEAAAKIYDLLQEPSNEALRILEVMRNELKERDVRNCYLFDDVYAALYLCKTAWKEVGELLASADAYDRT